MALETLVVETEHTTLDLLLWRVLRREVEGLVEDTLMRNPGLAALGPILPVGTAVMFMRPSQQDLHQPAETVVSLYD